MFEIEWTDAAYDDLARAWTPADSQRQAAINRAISTLEKFLERDPLMMGESRDRPTMRVVHREPVGFEVDIDESGAS